MNAKTLLTLFAAAAVLTAAPLGAEEPAKEMKCACMKEQDAKKQEMEKKMRAMEAKMKAETAEFDKLVDEMNSSTGDRKVMAMAAVINKMAQKQKEMKARCDMMMKGGMMMGMMKKDAKPGDVDYYTCKMHPSVHSPAPGKCPICSMDLVPVFKKGPDARPKVKPEAKPGEEPRKADDPHAGHH